MVVLVMAIWAALSMVVGFSLLAMSSWADRQSTRK
jgi:hypothetical protein